MLFLYQISDLVEVDRPQDRVSQVLHEVERAQQHWQAFQQVLRQLIVVWVLVVSLCLAQALLVLLDERQHLELKRICGEVAVFVELVLLENVPNFLQGLELHQQRF